MLTRRNLQSIASKEGIPLHTVERDYIQTLFLFTLSKQTTEFVFKGGTCLRMGHKLNRYSEDLDFNYPRQVEKGKKILRETTHRLQDFGVTCELKSENQTDSGFTEKLRYKGPLYNGTELSRGAIRIDVSCREENIQSIATAFHPRYDDCPTFIGNCLTLDQLLAEKIRALIVRGKPRDLYDIWFFADHLTMDRALIDQKLKLYHLQYDEVNLEGIFTKIESTWKQDLELLLNIVPDFNDAKKTVYEKLLQIQQEKK